MRPFILSKLPTINVRGAVFTGMVLALTPLVAIAGALEAWALDDLGLNE